MVTSSTRCLWPSMSHTRRMERPSPRDSQQKSSSSLSYASVFLWGISCGALSYYVAQEFCLHERSLDGQVVPTRSLTESSWLHKLESLFSMESILNGCDVLALAFHRATKRLRNLVLNHPPSWLLLLTCTAPLSQAQFFWYPLAFWWTICSVQDKDGESSNETLPTNSTNIYGEDAEPSTAPPQQQQHLELLVHNVSHTDMVLSVEAPETAAADDNDDEYCLCRPRFSAFDLYSRRILRSLTSTSTSSVVSFPRYERAADTRFSIVTPKAPSRRTQVPTGIQLPYEHEALTIPHEELSDLRFRGKDAPRVADPNAAPCATYLNYVFFPLLATLLPRWHQRMQDTHTNNKQKVKKVLLLVTGVGTPRNWTHSITGNSTEVCAQLMERFVHVVYPDVTVVRIHSDTNLFRYDENSVFVRRELLPCIDAYRDAHARGLPYPDEVTKTRHERSMKNHPFSPNWKQSFSVTLSFADGSPARTHAIQASLRPYRPTYFHVWQLKTFWHDTKIVDDDIEIHSFEEMETVPAMEATEVADVGVQLVVAEMKRFRANFLETVMDERNDIRQFWLRKTRKPVLAVLLVEGANGQPVVYRGTNMEVSMPTGSLCAERNVIGSALAMNPGLKREDLRMVAVLAVPLPRDTGSAPPLEELVRDPNMSRSESVTSYSSVVHDPPEEEDWILAQNGGSPDDLALAIQKALPADSGADFPVGTPPLHPKHATPPGTPIRRITLYSQASETNLNLHDSKKGKVARKQKRTILVHHCMEDLNPLRPCGACNEWLKKIAELNPYFKVVTFTDTECKGVYVSPCQE